MNLSGLTEKISNNPVKSRRVVYFEDTSGEIVAKVCTKCGKSKILEDYAKHRTCLGGRKSVCKDCGSEYREKNKERKSETTHKWYEANKEHDNEKKRKWRKENKEYCAEYLSNWRRDNHDKAIVLQQRRRACKYSLPSTLTSEQYLKTMVYFDNACALTGLTENIEKEHAIPLSIGHGGTTFGNCYPMVNGLNQSKGTKNIFEWFNANQQRFNLEQWRFDRLIDWLASANAMSVEEYRAYVYECHANPNVTDEADAI
jgi:hypothetical protein